MSTIDGKLRNQPTVRLTLITIGGLAMVSLSVIAALMRISSASWLSWASLAIMFCVFASCNFVMLLYTMWREGGSAEVRVSEINLTLFSALFYTLLAARAYNVYANHGAEADLVHDGLPSEVNNFTTVAQALASMRIQAFCELVIALNALIAFFWVGNAHRVYKVSKAGQTASHHSRSTEDELEEIVD